MSPRTYDRGKRQVQTEATRRRVAEAARALLAEATNYTEFTVDAVAKRADVARATVYYQFGSKAAVLEALCDALAEQGHIADVLEAISDPDPRVSLHGLIASLARFWAADRLVMRRLRALASLDADVEAVIAGRDDRRRRLLRSIVERLTTDVGRDHVDNETLVRTLHTLTSFETFDSLAGAHGGLQDAVDVVAALSDEVLRLAGLPVAASQDPFPP